MRARWGSRAAAALAWWRRSPGDRTIVVVAGTAVATLVLGLVLGRFVVSPAQAAADAAPPAAGLITVPAEVRSISNEVTLRGDARYDDPQPITVAPSEGGDGGPAVVTGAVPAVGATLDAGSVALEVTGRPVIVLPGELPVYRTLRLGASGPDVAQLKQGLWALGIASGSPGSDVYDTTVAAAVVELYERVGYTPPAPAEQDALDAAQARRAVDAATAAVESAEAAREAATAGPSKAARIAADNAVREQERQVRAATATGDAAAVAAATDALALARAERETALAEPAAPAEDAALAAATDELDAARASATRAREAVVTALPAAEVAYLPSLPRRVDEVAVRRGSTLDGPAMQVSGATLQVVASASTREAALLGAGMAASFDAPDGSEVTARVTAVEATPSAQAAGPVDGEDGGGASGEDGGEDGGGAGAASAAAGRSVVTLVPDELTDVQLTALQGANVRVSVPVAATDGDVLAVPLAALTAGPGGESRVERTTGQGATELVTVTTGLSAEGYAEITGGELEAGDLVVVGR